MKLLQRAVTLVTALLTTALYVAVKVYHEAVVLESTWLLPTCIPVEPEIHTTDDNSEELTPEVLVYPRRQYGIGIDGTAAEMNSSDLPKEDIAAYREGYEADDFNGYLSDIISLHRIINDYRPDICKSLKYPDDLPSAGIVIPFKNEHLSILLRTVYSILYNTPEHLLDEIVLVDDGSVNDELGSKLEIHVANLPKVRLIRLGESRGLMMARQAGIDNVTSEYFICMDCHMEVLPGWIEPLLARLKEEPKALLCSNVGSIFRDTFKLNHAELWQIRGHFPAFLFNLDATTAKYKQSFIDWRNNDTWPFPFGIIQGMMIVMSRSWFLQLGGFDPGMKIWGSEQMELSIKVWTCGGRVEMIPCSYVGHMFRRNVWKMRNEGVMNILRVAEVWLDEHKHRIYEYYHNRRKEIDVGDISDRVRIREENNCKPFDFYLESIKQFADIEFTEIQRRGAVRNMRTNNCLDAMPNRKGPIQYPCHGDEVQYFELTEKGRLRFLEHCLLPEKNGTVLTVSLKFCTWHIPDESDAVWLHNDEGQIIHQKSGDCLEASNDMKSLLLNTCTEGNNAQMWTWTVMT